MICKQLKERVYSHNFLYFTFQVPRVFINGKCIGGGSEAQALDNSGELKRMLTS